MISNISGNSKSGQINLNINTAGTAGHSHAHAQASAQAHSHGNAQASAQAHSHSHSHGHAPQPAIRPPQNTVNINSTGGCRQPQPAAPQCQQAKPAAAAAAATKEKAGMKGLLDFFKKGMDMFKNIFKSVIDTVGSIGGGMLSLATKLVDPIMKLAAPLLKMVGIGK